MHHKERLTFESRSTSVRSSQHTESLKRNSVRALKNTYSRPGGLEMILASIDDSLVLLSDLIATTAADNANLRNHKERNKFFSANPADNDQNCMRRKSVKILDNCDNSIEKKQAECAKTAKIDLTGEEIVQWMGGLPMINPNKMLGYFCSGLSGNHQEAKKVLPDREPYKIFSLNNTQKWQFNDQTIAGNLIREVC
ncbi:unnamed protein product [Litomosoides sigmodontis]|uniref:Uncharacterized protein n=1 Tax=Litomosoides sigmodontis TaxID=42156 RepID=A0A3P6TJF2_LITSI|nr:unnamed protein product [Litomosoides sigmodontis]